MTPEATTATETIAPLSQADQDAIKRHVDKTVGSELAGIVEKRFKDRPEQLDEQYVRTAAAFAAESAYVEATDGYPVMGALFAQMAKMGRKEGGTSLHRANHDKLIEGFKKSVGPRAAKTVNLATADEGGLLVEGTVLELWLEPLRAASVVLAALPEIVPVIGGKFKVTGWETDPQIIWTEEENTLPLTSTPATGERETAMRKAMALMPVTAEYRESASPQIFRRLEEMMRAAFATGFDERFINGTGLANRIKGLRNHISETADATGTGTLANVLDDAKTVMTSVESSNVQPQLRHHWFFSPRTKFHLMFVTRTADDLPFFLTEMRAGTFLGAPFSSTTNIPTNLGGGSDESFIIFQAMNQFFIGMGPNLDIQWFQNASYTEGGNLVSSIERDTEVLRGRQLTSTLMPHQNAGFVLTAVPY